MSLFFVVVFVLRKPILILSKLIQGFVVYRNAFFLFLFFFVFFVV